jgi:hypothetical protein
MLGYCYVFGRRSKKELVFAGTFLQKGIPGKLPLKKKEHGKEFLFFCRNLEVIPQDSWNWKAKKKERNKECTTKNALLVAEHHAGVSHTNIISLIGRHTAKLFAAILPNCSPHWMPPPQL